MNEAVSNAIINLTEDFYRQHARYQIVRLHPDSDNFDFNVECTVNPPILDVLESGDYSLTMELPEDQQGEHQKYLVYVIDKDSGEFQ